MNLSETAYRWLRDNGITERLPHGPTVRIDAGATRLSVDVMSCTDSQPARTGVGAALRTIRTVLLIAPLTPRVRAALLRAGALLIEDA